MVIRSAIYLVLLMLVLAGAVSCKKEDVRYDYEYKTLGTSARDLLSDARFTALDIEISYSPGYQPTDSVLNEFRIFLDRYIKKPGGIRFYPKLLTGNVASPLSVSAMVSLEKSVRTKYTVGQTLAVHFMIPAAESGGVQVLGTSYWNTSTCFFGKTMDKFSGGAGQVGKNFLMLNLFEHEMGHLLGLVDQGSPMVTPHKDAANGAHCSNRFCLMNYLIETGGSGTIIPLFDNNCLSDLRNNGGK